MTVRCLIHEVSLPATPERAFAALGSPGILCLPTGSPAGFDARFFCAATVESYEPPRLLAMRFSISRRGPRGRQVLVAEFDVELTARRRSGGSILRVTQQGFTDSDSGETYEQFKRAWTVAFEKVRHLLVGG